MFVTPFAGASFIQDQSKDPSGSHDHLSNLFFSRSLGWSTVLLSPTTLLRRNIYFKFSFTIRFKFISIRFKLISNLSHYSTRERIDQVWSGKIWKKKKKKKTTNPSYIDRLISEVNSQLRWNTRFKKKYFYSWNTVKVSACNSWHFSTAQYRRGLEKFGRGSRKQRGQENASAASKPTVLRPIFSFNPSSYLRSNRRKSKRLKKKKESKEKKVYIKRAKKKDEKRKKKNKRETRSIEYVESVR